MAKSVLPFNVKGRCYICHAQCETDEHHIFEGANRKASDKYGLTVYLCRVCHRRAHDFPKEFEEKYHLKRMTQTAAMVRYGWDIKQWRRLFRKDYRYGMAQQ